MIKLASLNELQLIYNINIYIIIINTIIIQIIKKINGPKTFKRARAFISK